MFLIFLLEVRKQMDYLRGIHSHVGQEKELQFDMQLISGSVSYFKNAWREGGFPAREGSNARKQKCKLHPLTSTGKRRVAHY